MAQRIQQIGAPRYEDQELQLESLEPLGGQPVYDPTSGGRYFDYSSLPQELAKSSERVGRDIWNGWAGMTGGVLAPVTAVAGQLVGGKKGREAGWNLGGGREAEAYWNNVWKPIVSYNSETGFLPGGNDDSSAAGDAVLNKFTGTPYSFDQYLASDPAYNVLLAKQASAEQATQELRQLLGTATLETSGAYGAAANQGRRTGANINTRGQATGNEIADYYGDAANFASDMSQAGGTAVSGLTGPSSAFQSIYGDSYGTGTGMSEAARSTASLASEDMMAEAQRTAGMGGTASKNLNKYWNVMNTRERQAFTNALIDSKALAQQNYNAAKGNLDLFYAAMNNTLASGTKDQKKRLKNELGVKNSNDVATYIDNLEAKLGPVGAASQLTRTGLFGTTK